MKNTIIALVGVIVILIGVSVYYYTRDTTPLVLEKEESTSIPSPSQAQSNNPTTTAIVQQGDKTKTVIGKSVEGVDIVAYHYGAGNKEILFVGGIHGGYEWNTSLVAYNLMDYLEQNQSVIPAGVTVSVIPVLNPDGLKKVVKTTGKFTSADVSSSQELQVSGRFNANNVDLNRNFDCDWQSVGMWQKTKVSGGTEVFSEPESKAIKQYVESRRPAAAIVWYSAANGVYSSNCHNGVLAETSVLTTLYSKASGYPAYENFDFYAITGDMTNWLAKNNIPAISVLLSTHDSAEWDKNKAGVNALLEHFAQ